MKAAVITARVLISISGIAALLLGILFWTGNFLFLLPLHMLLGVVLVLSLWLAAGLGLRAHAPVGLTVAVLAFSLIVPALGITQVGLLPGRLHWVIQLLHLLVGGVAMGLGHLLARRIMAAQPALKVAGAS